jgi:D-alanyl-D-alanine carboxypeptidase
MRVPIKLTRSTAVVAFSLALVVATVPDADALAPLNHAAVLAAIPTVVAAGSPAFVMAAIDESGSWSAAAGSADLKTGALASPAAAFRIGSISKMFVAVAVLKLVDQGKIGLDQHVGTYLPGLLERGDVITIRELLQHRSGLGPTQIGPLEPRSKGWLGAGAADCHKTFDPVVVIKAADVQLFEPGTAFTYANAGYTTLELVIEKVTGKPYAQVLSDLIIRPLGLTHTSFQDGAPVWPRPYLHGYDDHLPDIAGIGNSSNKQLIDESGCSESIFGAAGSGISTTSDLITFLRALTHGVLLPDYLYQQMIDGQPSDFGPTVTYGLGILVQNVCGTTVLGHSGGVFGYQANVWTTTDGTRTFADAYTLFPGTDPMYNAVRSVHRLEVCNGGPA